MGWLLPLPFLPVVRRFTASQLDEVVHYIFPHYVSTERIPRCPNMLPLEVLLIVLFRLAYPVRFRTMTLFFGRSETVLCRVFNFAINSILGTGLVTSHVWGFIVLLQQSATAGYCAGRGNH